MRRRLSIHVYEKLQALIQTHTFNELYELFNKEHPGDKLSIAQFKKLKPWNLKKVRAPPLNCAR